MRTKTPLILAALGLLISAGVAVKERLAVAELGDARDTARVKRLKLDAELHRLRQTFADAREPKSNLENPVETAGSVPEIAAATSAVPPVAGVRDTMLADPQFQNLQLAARRASLAGTYGPLLIRLGLSRPQAEKFQDLLLAHDEKRIDAEAVREIQRLPIDDTAITRFNGEISAELHAAQKTLLGETGYAQLQDYERSLPAREATDTFAGTAAVAGAPLSPDQAERLTFALANTSATFRAGARAQGLDWEAALVPATNFLSPAQLALVERTLASDRYLRRIQALAARPSGPMSADGPPSR